MTFMCCVAEYILSTVGVRESCERKRDGYKHHADVHCGSDAGHKSLFSSNTIPSPQGGSHAVSVIGNSLIGHTLRVL